MRINKLLASAIIGAMLALEGWTLKEVVALKVQVAQLQTQLADHMQQKHFAQK
jgi:hypothetical protein